MNELHIAMALNALNYFTLVCNVISVLVEMVNFVMIKVDYFCKCREIIVLFKFLDRKDA